MMTAPLSLVSSAPVIVRDDVPAAMAEAYVASHPAGSTYHRPAWIQVVRQAFGHEAQYSAAMAGDRIVGVLPLVFFRSRVFGRLRHDRPLSRAGAAAG